MPASNRNDPPTQTASGPSSGPRYPEGHTLGVLDSPEQVRCAVAALAGRFLEPEIEILAGGDQAERLRETTGRTGLMDKALRFLQGLGMWNDELEVKARYEQALEEGRYIVEVSTPTDERKQLASRVLQDCGGHFINYFGTLAREELVPWAGSRAR